MKLFPDNPPRLRHCKQCDWRGVSKGQERSRYFTFGYLALCMVIIGSSAFELFDLGGVLTMPVTIGIMAVFFGIPAAMEWSDRCPVCAKRLPLWY